MASIRTESAGLRVSVRLDPGMLVEALILARLDGLPKRRHQDWIRSLLVQGFLAESRVVRQLYRPAPDSPVDQRSGPGAARSGFAFSDWAARSADLEPVARAAPAEQKENRGGAVKQGNTDKPFAHLRKVVG